MFDFIKRNLIKLRNFRKKIYLREKTNVGMSTIFEGQNVINKGSVFSGYIGWGSYIGVDCNINAKIGRFCSIAGGVRTINGFHPSAIQVSTHPAFFSTARQNGITFVKSSKYNEHRYADEENKYSVIIGNDVWIGYGAKIMAGIKIGDGAIVAAGAIVTKDVEPYSIVGGIPAKIISKRFQDQEIDFLLNLRWWDRPLEWVQKNADYFSNINDLKKHIEGEQ